MEAPTTFEGARSGLASWVAERTRVLERGPVLLRLGLRAYAPEVDRQAGERIEAFARQVVHEIDPAVRELELAQPQLVSTDPVGRPAQAVAFHPSYAAVGRVVWASGLLAPPARARTFERAALFYLLSLAGEAGHACPVACTLGLALALEQWGPADLAARFVPALLGANYDSALRASQFLTEVHSGSDVGANLTRAVPDEGRWRIWGEKWFCSVADADLFAVTARLPGAAEGTRGLGCFVVPRRLAGGEPNGFRVLRLKDKLGTRALATGEVVFEGAEAWAVGDPADGFRIAAEGLLNTSRWLNALAAAAFVWRAAVEAWTFAAHRQAFGEPIASYPAVRELLARIGAEAAGALGSGLELTRLVACVQEARASEADRAAWRLVVNANKFVTSLQATAAIRDAIEVVGGNGTIEDLTALPRLLRDAIVLESWEGAHNVLCAQVLRDARRLQTSLSAPVERRLDALSPQDAAWLAELVAANRPAFDKAVSDPAFAAAEGKRVVWRLGRLWEVLGCLTLAQAADREQAPQLARGLRAASRLLVSPGMGTPLVDGPPPELVEEVCEGLGGLVA